MYNRCVCGNQSVSNEKLFASILNTLNRRILPRLKKIIKKCLRHFGNYPLQLKKTSSLRKQEHDRQEKITPSGKYLQVYFNRLATHARRNRAGQSRGWLMDSGWSGTGCARYLTVSVNKIFKKHLSCLTNYYKPLKRLIII